LCKQPPPLVPTNQNKIQFLRNELWKDTIAASFRRASVYRTGANEKRAKDFKDELREHLKTVESDYTDKTNPCSDAQHLANIKSIQLLSRKYKDVFAEKEAAVEGTAQPTANSPGEPVLESQPQLLKAFIFITKSNHLPRTKR